MYKVVADFKDLRDGGYEYKVGDTYPRQGMAVSGERVIALSTPTSGRGALIEEVVVNEPPIEDEKSKKKAKQKEV